MSSIEKPDFLSTFGTAYIGPSPIISGLHPAAEKLTNLAIGLTPKAWAFSADINTTKEAPSLVCEEVAAVTLPSSAKQGLKVDSFSIAVPGLIPSSSVTSLSCPSCPFTFTGMMDFARSPLCCAS